VKLVKKIMSSSLQLLCPFETQLVEPDPAAADEQLPLDALPVLDPESESLEEEVDVEEPDVWIFAPGKHLLDKMNGQRTLPCAQAT
jgi:hypothetical protein